MTNVPQIQFTPAGLVVPTEAEILAGVQIDNNAAFGGNLNPALETPQGQLASSLAAIIADKDSQIAFLSNQFDPTNAEGRFQDALGKIYFITRIPSAGTVVQATCEGLSGTIIPVGATALNSSTGEKYVCTTATTLVGGSGVATFTNTNPGPNACPPGALDTIYQAIPGWERITNLSAGALGRSVESRAEFEERRRASVALNAKGYTESIRANVLQVEGVLSCYVVDNNTSSTVMIDGVNITAYSVYIAVVGGNSNDVARAIWRTKSLGAPYAAGNTTVTVYDDTYPIPYPSYSVRYTVPTNVPIYFTVTIEDSDTLPVNTDAMIKQAILNVFSGADGGQSVNIGYSIFASKFYGTITNLNPSINIISIKVDPFSAPSHDSVNIFINQYPTIDPANIQIIRV